MYTLMVVDDHPLFRDAIGVVIAAGLPGCRLLEADNLACVLQQAESLEDLDLLLLDLGLPDAEGLSGLAQLREAQPHLPVAILSAEQDRRVVLEAIDMGAVGYIPKSTPGDNLLTAIKRILAGQVYLPPEIVRGPLCGSTPASTDTVTASVDRARFAELTDKQLEVLMHMGRGESNKLIAWELDIAETTVKTHVSAIFRKLGVTSRVQATLAARSVDIEALLLVRRQA